MGRAKPQTSSLQLPAVHSCPCSERGSQADPAGPPQESSPQAASQSQKSSLNPTCGTPGPAPKQLTCPSSSNLAPTAQKSSPGHHAATRAGPKPAHLRTEVHHGQRAPNVLTSACPSCVATGQDSDVVGPSTNAAAAWQACQGRTSVQRTYPLTCRPKPAHPERELPPYPLTRDPKPPHPKPQKGSPSNQKLKQWQGLAAHSNINTSIPIFQGLQAPTDKPGDFPKLEPASCSAVAAFR